MAQQVAIQATQYIITVLEDSKLQSEESLDNMPGIYAIIDEQGQILKGNKNLAEALDVNHEHLLGANFRLLFSSEGWEGFQKELSAVQNTKERHDFRIDTNRGGNLRNYLWHASIFVINRSSTPQLFSILGHDVTDFT